MAINMNELFDENATFKKTIYLLRQNSSNFDSLSTVEKFTNVFVKNSEIPNIIKIMSFIFSMPATTGFVERIFSIMNNKLSCVRNKCPVELIRTKLLTTIHFNLNCKEFYDIIKNDHLLLKKAPKMISILINQKGISFALCNKVTFF